jgi:Ca2+-binding RTX toxin-like protein
LNEGALQRRIARAAQIHRGIRRMTIYTVTTANWNDPAFWSSINEGTSGHTLDFSALPSGYTVDFWPDGNEIYIYFGNTVFIIADSASPGAATADVTLVGSTLIEYFTDVRGGQDYDLLDGSGNDEVLSGEGGDDDVFGGAGNDVIDGGAGNDRIDGGDGNDTLIGGDGTDTLDGGTGNDAIDGGGGNDTIDGGDGNDTLFGGNSDPIPPTFSGDFNDVATDPGVTISGAGTNNGSRWRFDSNQEGSITFDPDQGGADVGGVASIDTSFRFDTGSGSGSLSWSFGDPATMAANPGQGLTSGLTIEAVTIGGSNKDNFVFKWNGVVISTQSTGTNDVAQTGVANATFSISETGLVTFNISSYAQPTYTAQIPGTEWQDADTSVYQFVAGSDFTGWHYIQDVEFSGTTQQPEDDDVITGGAGDDLIDGGAGADTIDGGADTDTVTYATSDAAVNVDLTNTGAQSGGDAEGDILSNIENLTGSAFNDTLTGNSGANVISGGDGNDVIEGGAGDDDVSGGAGDDTIAGGAGADKLTGGSGADKFVVDDGGDLITDFDTSTGINDDGSVNNDYVDLSAFYNATTLAAWNAANPGRTYATPQQWLRADQADGSLNQVGGLQIQNGGSAVAASELNEENTGVVCFTVGTLILTPMGDVPIENLRPGDKVVTRDNGVQTLVWSAMRKLDNGALAQNPKLRPIYIAPDLVGASKPLLVSPQHGMLIRKEGGDEVLVRATHLARLRGGKARVAEGRKSVTYIHLMFEAHQIIFANGAPSESFYPGPQALNMLHGAAARDLKSLFGDLFEKPVAEIFGKTARDFARFKDLPVTLNQLGAC